MAEQVTLEDPPDLSWRREPYFGPPKVIDLERERLRRTPVMFVGYVIERDVRGADASAAVHEWRLSEPVWKVLNHKNRL